MANPNQDARSGRGQYVRTPEAIARDTEAARLYFEEHLSYRQVAKEMGYKHHSSAMEAINRVMRTANQPAQELRDRRDRELQFLWDAAMEIFNKQHVVVSFGKVIERDGEPLEDNGPKLQALDQLRKINAEWRKLHGADQPVRLEATVHEVTQQDLELQEMLREAKASVDAEEQQIRDGGDA